jgi:transcriptional regulator with XRE-family HTH domain
VADSPGARARDLGKAQLQRLGRVIREQRTAAELSLRDLAARTNVSNPYLSQLERGLHEPSVRVLKAIATALNMSAEALMVQAGMLDEPTDADPATSVVDAVRADPLLTDDQRSALLTVYRSYIQESRGDQ